MVKIVLASTSRYRADLLSKLQLPFIQADPQYQEEALVGETTAALCQRLALGKARAAARTQSAPFLVIGSDQVASTGTHVLGKPGTFERALAQLQLCRGQWVTFDTAICVVDHNGRETTRFEAFSVHFRDLDDAALCDYLNLDEPFDCAGSIKLESLGIALIDDTRGRDLNTALGLPLMLLREMLEEVGINLPNDINYRR